MAMSVKNGLSCFPCLGKKRTSAIQSQYEVKENDNDLQVNGNFIQDTMDNDADDNRDVTPSPMTNTTVSPSSISMQHVTSSTCSPPPPQPQKFAFLVSFMVDARGGAMTGGRGSGLRLIIPQGAVEQPIRVTCRYLRSGQGMLYPPPLMEREALASRVIEMGPAGACFQAPVLIEVPHFASLRQGERELVVLRSDDGETWQEHTMTYYSSWSNANQENDIYQDFLVNSQIGAAFEVLSTDRVVRISTKVFPQYFAILSRVKEEVRVVGFDGGKITVQHTPQLQVYFPEGALQKRIKVALQVQTVPASLVSLIHPEKAGRTFRASPLVALDPRRRRFHCPVQVMVPLPRKATKLTNRRIRLLCSLTGNVSRANWEDVTEATPLVSKSDDRVIIFETKVSALFWVVAIDDDPQGEDPNMIMSRSEYEDISRIDDRDAIISRVATALYDELVLPPYMARILVLFRPHAPHAWCDTLLIFCVTDDKADLAFDSKHSFANSCSTLRSIKSVVGEEWKLLLQSDEMELSGSSQLKFSLDRSRGNLVVAQDCQFEYGYRQSLTFVPFQNNSCTLLVRAPDPSKPKRNRLVVSKVVVSGPTEEPETPVLCTLTIDLDGGRPSVSPERIAPDLEPVGVPQNPSTITSLVSHVVQWASSNSREVSPETTIPPKVPKPTTLNIESA